MRRFLVTTLAVPALLLSACGSDAEPEVEEPAASASSEPTQDVAEETTEDVVEETAEEPTEDVAEATEEPTSDGEVEGGEDGQAAADVTKQFMVALANADPEICGLLMDFTGSGPMSASEEDMALCEQILPSTLEGMITEEQASIIELIEVNGADVQGDTATVDKDNFSELFGEGFGDDAIALQKFDDTWYVDLDNSFEGAGN
ncbi:MAG: hypothetical protein WA880_05560 [Ornithinimicrobium sp.]